MSFSKRGEKAKYHGKAKYHEMCGIRGESKSERAVRVFPLWKAVCASGMACSSVSAEQGCLLPALYTEQQSQFSEKTKAKEEATLNSEAVLESERMSFFP